MGILDSSKFIWSFDTPEIPGFVSTVFADNQSENEIWKRLKQFLPVCFDDPFPHCVHCVGGSSEGDNDDSKVSIYYCVK